MAAVPPVVVAERFWRTVALPVPKPSVPPGYAVTGMPAYLVTDGTTRLAPVHEMTPLGMLSISATGAYTVSWGDGATSGPYNVEGEPYPDGVIRHTYEDVGTVSVTVVEHWTATWRLGAAGGTLDQLETRAVIPDFEARQIQAVIVQQ